MKGQLWAQILSSLTVCLGQPTPQYQSFVGCFHDDKSRDLKEWKFNLGKGYHDHHTLNKCREWAKKKKKKYFSLQWGQSCAIANSFGKGKYSQVLPAKCIRNGYTCGNSEHMEYCGGAWANAVYTTKPRGPPYMVKANKWMQLNSPWNNHACVGTWQSGVDVKMIDCDYRGAGATEKNYLWQFDKHGRLLNPRWKGRCLDVHLHNRNVFMSPCHGGNNQKWYWNFGSNLISKWKSYTMDWHTGNNNIFAGGWHSGDNLRFWWNIGQPLQIKGGVKGGRVWLSTASNGRKVDLWKVNGNRQKWEFIQREKGWYNIMLSGGMIIHRGDLRLGNMYLSVTQDGKKLDLYGKDDGSGRQRWKIKKLKDGYYNILVACVKKNCVKDGRKYLSTNTKGEYVDLWKKDDKSGRQRWKLFDHELTPKPTPRPTPKPTPVPVRNLISGGGWKIVKGQKKCTISIENGVKFPCAVSPNYPKPYGREQKCEISMSKKTEYVALEGSTENFFDFLTLAGKKFSGKLKGKKVKVKGKSTATWTADFWEGTKGWKFCKAQAPRLKIVNKKKDKKDKKKKDKKDKKKRKKRKR